MSALKAAREWAATSTLAHVGFAFLAMGGWAVFANRDHALGQVLLSGLVQGTVSALLTLGLKKFLEWFNAKLAGPAALIVPPLVTAATILAILISAHKLAGTPEIAATIAVPFTVSTTYAIIYNWGLWRRRRA
jgi:mannose/fructose/N-acetylgalactosamine-specific phosphotransferase system component IIC